MRWPCWNRLCPRRSVPRTARVSLSSAASLWMGRATCGGTSFPPARSGSSGQAPTGKRNAWDRFPGTTNSFPCRRRASLHRSRFRRREARVERFAFVEYEAVAMKMGAADLLEVFEDAAVELPHMVEAGFSHVDRCLLAADTTG